ncbi:MAG: hypothetical protein HRT98_04340 [Mycoplasmatales bacterium]|nr:hypothetical protein [Mycoplasmatales bacterium]
MNKKKKKIIKMSIVPLVAISTTAIALPLAIHNKNVKENQFKNIKLFNRTFKSREELISYALKNAKLFSDKRGGHYFSLEDSGEKLFKTNEELRNYISKNIEIIMVKNAVRIENSFFGGMGEIENVNPILAASHSIEKQYFRGFNDTIFTKRIDAINSYFQYHKVYYYDGIAFRNTEELKRYLFKNYDKLRDFKLQGTTINMVAPSGLTSDFINLDKEEDRQRGRNFVKNTATSLIGFRRKDGQYNYIKSSEILSKDFNDGTTELPINQINAIHLKANDGKATWVVDSSVSDQANFYGDYFTKSKTDSIKDITGDTWDKTSDTPDPSLLKKSKNAKTIGSLFIILNKINAYNGVDLNNKKEVKALNNIKNIFDIPKYQKLMIPNDTSLDKDKINSIFHDLKRISNSISQGKRYNPLYELPLLYEKVMSNIDGLKIKNKELNFIRKFFQAVADDYQNILETLLPKSSLINRDGKQVNIADLFGINKSSYDLNSTPEFQMYQLSESPKFVAAAEFLISAINNKISNGGAMLYSMSKFAYNKNIIDQEYYSKIWNLFATSEEFQNIEKLKTYLGNDNLKNEQLKLISSILKINNKLAEANNELFMKSVKAKVELIINNFSKDGYVEISALKQNVDTNSKLNKAIKWYRSKEKTIVKLAKFKQGATRVTTAHFREIIRTFNLKTSMIGNVLVQMSKLDKKYQKDYQNVKKQLNEKITDQKKEKLQKLASIDAKISKGLKGAQGVRDGILGVAKFVNAIQNQDIYGGLKAASEILGTIGELTSSVPILGPVIQVLAFATDIVAEIIGKTVQENYKFQTSDQDSHPFYWDGGKATNRFWGLMHTVESDVSNMKLINPQKIIKGRQKDVWIYNGEAFYDENELRKQALWDFANGDDDAILFGTKNKFLKRSFSYNKNSIKNGQINHGIKVWDSKEKLAQELLPLLSEKNKQNAWKYDRNKGAIKDFIGLIQLSIIGGKVIQASGTSGLNAINIKKVSINELISKIKPTLVAQLPKTIGGIPIDQYDQKNIKEKTETIKNIYKLPGQKHYKLGAIKTSKNTNQYLQVNMNEVIKQTGNNSKPTFKYASVEEAVDKLRKEFIKNIAVKSIYSLVSQELNSNHFSQLKAPKEFNLFKVKGIRGEIKYFKSFSDAVKWLTSRDQFNLKRIISENKNKELNFNGIKFKNTNELLKYLDKLWKENQ